MKVTILGRFSDFIKALPSGWGAGYPTREEAVKIYLSTGGLLKVDSSNKDNPRLVYPGKARIHTQLDDLKHKLSYMNSQVAFWDREYGQLGAGYFDGVFKVADPLYWEHTFKFRFDANYRKAFDTVEMPISLIKDKKWRKTIRMFVHSPEYRERLVEARTSEIGKMRDSIKVAVQKSKDFKRDVVKERLDKMKKERDMYDRKEKALRVLLSWAED